MKRKLKKPLLISLLFLASLSKLVYATTDFDISVCNSGCDYVSYNTVKTAVGGKNLTDAVVLSHSGISGSMPDGSSVTGGTSGATGTAVHVSSNQICIYGITGTFQSGEEIYETDGVNYVTSSSAPDSANVIITFSDDQEIVGQPNWDSGTYNDDQVVLQGDDSEWDGTCANAVKFISKTYSFSNIFIGTGTIKLSWKKICFVAESPAVQVWRGGGTAIIKTYDTIYSGAILQHGYGGNIYAYNTLILDPPTYGIRYENSYGACKFWGLTVLNAGEYGIRDEQSEYSSSRGIELYNAVIAGSGTADIYAVDGTLVTCDYVATSDGTATDCGYNSTASPQTGITSSDLSYTTGFLASGSSLIDAGYDYSGTTGISTDIIGTTRPQGLAWDIGAFEYIAEESTWRPQIIGIY